MKRLVRVNNEEMVTSSLRGAIVWFGQGPAEGGAPSTDRLARVASHPGGPFRRLLCVRQVHGTRCLHVAEPPTVKALEGPEADGLFTELLGVGLTIWTADCVPVVLSDGRAVAAVHCGWRGLAAGILNVLLDALASKLRVKPADLHVLLGPAIGPCHYEVGHDVIERLATQGVPIRLWLHDRRVDLRALVRHQLIQLGVKKVHIGRVGGCTACDPKLASFRRDGPKAGRQLTVIGRPADP